MASTPDYPAEHDRTLAQLREVGLYDRVSEVLRLDTVWVRHFTADANSVQVHFLPRERRGDDADGDLYLSWDLLPIRDCDVIQRLE